MAKKILVVDDDADMRMALELTLKKSGYDCVLAKDGQAALDRLKKERFDAMVTDLRMPRVDGIELLERLSAVAPKLPALVITAHGSVDVAVESMKRGAVDFLQKPFGPEILTAKLEIVLARGEEGAVSPGKPTSAMIATDVSMKPVLDMVDAAAQTRATVLITGESGTGKEVIAKRIHELSDWAKGPFVAVNCAAIPATLMESELFGHVKGSFTGATDSRPGRFEQAQGGTILLDEVSEMDPALQAKLLRVLQEREVERVGGREVIPLEVKVIATSNRDLPERVAESKFREDLYYRLHVLPIELPPLRERKSDILELAKHFLASAREDAVPEPPFTPEAERALMDHDWPGNVRELQNTVERGVVLSRGNPVEPGHLLLRGSPAGQPAVPELTGTLEEMEKQLILAAFDKNGRNKKATARALGINIKTLRSRLSSYGVGGPEEEAGE